MQKGGVQRRGVNPSIRKKLHDSAPAIPFTRASTAGVEGAPQSAHNNCLPERVGGGGGVWGGGGGGGGGGEGLLVGGGGR